RLPVPWPCWRLASQGLRLRSASCSPFWLGRATNLTRRVKGNFESGRALRISIVPPIGPNLADLSQIHPFQIGNDGGLALYKFPIGVFGQCNCVPGRKLWRDRSNHPGIHAHAGVVTMSGPDIRRIGTHPDHWHPIAWSKEVKIGKAIGKCFASDPIVLYRGTSGRMFALEDRCAHRQVPLHLGVVGGDALRCGYHGWTYNCAGACVDVPYLGRERLPNGVRSYPVTEVDGMIFIFPGEDITLAEPRKPASIGSKSDRRYVTRRLARDVACHYSFMHENLFDMNHQFLHRR